MLAAIPKADLVVMNPTHYAVAIKATRTARWPRRVVAKGVDLLALKIRDLARACAQVPVLEAPMLAARALRPRELDQEIPAGAVRRVAQVLAYVYQLRARAAWPRPRARRAAELPVPPELDPHNTGA